MTSTLQHDAATTPAGGTPPGAPRPARRTRWRSTALVAAVLATGLAGGFLAARALSPAAAPGPAEDVAAEDVVAEAPPADGAATASVGDGLEPLGANEATAVRAAADAFLAAEAARDFATSFELLSAADREAEGLVAAWEQRHADLPPIEAADVTAVGRRGADVVAVADLELRSSLDEFAGLVPARAEGAFVLVEEDGAWKVRFEEATIIPRFPDDADAPVAAATWAGAQQRCEEAPSPYTGPQYGVPTLAVALCGVDADLTVGEASALPEGDDASPFVAAFGPEVFSWARVVPVGGPAPLRVVLAPVDDAWTVIGVLRPAS